MTEKTRKTLLNIYNWIYKIIFGYSQITLVAVIGIVSAQVIARNVFRSNIRWNQEVALLFTIWMAFLGIAIGVDKGLHIEVELFYSFFPAKMKKVIDWINYIFLELAGFFFTVYGVKLIISTTRSKMTVTKWPACLMYIMIPVSGMCIMYFVLLKMLGVDTEEEKGALI